MSREYGSFPPSLRRYSTTPDATRATWLYDPMGSTMDLSQENRPRIGGPKEMIT